MNKRQFNLELATTSSCNMACTYCFEGEELQAKKQQTQESIPDIISKIELLLSNQDFNLEYPDGICINFWGGEPTLNFKWNKELIETLEAKEYSKNLSYFIYSNGFNLPKIVDHISLFTRDQLKQSKLRIQISWDGIHNGRIGHNGETTNQIVKNHINSLILLYPELNLVTKATIQPQELLRLEEIWNNHYKFHQQVERVANGLKGCNNTINTRITFSPTLNYVDNFDDTDEEYLKAIAIEFQKVLLLEQAFYKKYKYHLFEWFSNDFKEARGKRLTNCSAGINLMALDYNGNFSSCHGVLYSENKNNFEKFHNLNIKQSPKDFTKNFFESRSKLKFHTEYVADSCISCEATVCYKCPVVNIDQLSKNKGNDTSNVTNLTYLKPFEQTYQIRDTRHCQIYKLFGKYDRVLMTLKNKDKEI